MTSKTFLIGLSALALGVGGTAMAQNHDRGGRMGDADGNGVVTSAEAQTRAAAMFDRMDANKDGVLTEADRTLRMEQMRTRMFESLDSDKNGQISRAEFMAFRHEGGRGGMAKDGAAMGGMKHGEGHGDAGHHRMGMRGHGGGMKMMRMADTDKDGRITRAEFTAAAQARFARTDANSDGQITQDERKAMRDQMRAKWQERREDKSSS